MTRIGRRLIEDFLLPALNDQRYGDRLQWVDKNNMCFSIRWSHKNAAKWTLEDTVVFQDWDKLKGHFHPEIKGYYMQAKQRFRAALYKLNTVRKVRSQEKHTKIYQLVLSNDKKKTNDSPVMQPKFGKDGPCIPTSVICRNVNYVPPKHSVLDSTKHSNELKKENNGFLFHCLSNDSSSLSNDASDEVGIAEPKQCTILVPNPSDCKMEKDADEVHYCKMEKDVDEVHYCKMEKDADEVHYRKMAKNVGEIRVQPHLPVQPVPAYSPKLRTIQPLQQRWENSCNTSLQVKESLPCLKATIEPMDYSEALNLSVKSEIYNIPVPGR